MSARRSRTQLQQALPPLPPPPPPTNRLCVCARARSCTHATRGEARATLHPKRLGRLTARPGKPGTLEAMPCDRFKRQPSLGRRGTLTGPVSVSSQHQGAARNGLPL